MFSLSGYHGRLIKQLADVIYRAQNLQVEGQEEKAKQVLADACGELLGVEHRVLNMLDAKSAVALLGERARVDAYAQLVESMGDTARASELRSLR